MTDSVRFALALFALTMPTFAAGCGSDGSPAEVHSYVDSSARSCTVDLNDISGTATCDVQPSTVVTCASGDPVFVVNDDYDFMTHIWTLKSCGGCIDRANHTTNIASMTCANITCMAATDCPSHGAYQCNSGICTHM